MNKIFLMTALLATATSMSASYNGRVFVDITDTEKFNTTRHEDWINNLHDYAANEQVELDGRDAAGRPICRQGAGDKDTDPFQRWKDVGNRLPHPACRVLPTCTSGRLTLHLHK